MKNKDSSLSRKLLRKTKGGTANIFHFEPKFNYLNYIKINLHTLKCFTSILPTGK